MNCQQYELYNAERGVPTGRSFSTLEETQAYVDEMTGSDWWERNFSNVQRVEVFYRETGDCSVGGFMKSINAGVIEMLPCHRNELVVIHEVCHVLASARYESHAHDPWFALIYLEAVYTFMGSEAYKALHDRFCECGIDHDTTNSNPAGIEL